MNTKSRFEHGRRWMSCSAAAGAMALGLIATPAGAQTEVAKLTASEAAAGDFFGFSVSVDGDVAVVGAHHLAPGSAYVYRFDGSTWNHEAKLTASDAPAGLFGISVSVSGDLAVVGASFGDGIVSHSGAAYVFRFDGTTWNEEAKLAASDGGVADRFGISVAISGNLAVVGAFEDDDAGSSSGSAYVFRFDPGTSEWVQQAKLTASDAAAVDQFGVSVSVSGDVAIVGAQGNDDAGIASGSAYVYRFDPGTSAWVEKAKLTASDGAAFDCFFDCFGHSVSVSGDVAVVGAQGRDDAGSLSGAAYVFRFDGTTWNEEAKLVASDAPAGGFHFGGAVSLSGDVAIVGAEGDSDAGDASGAAYVFSFDPDTPGWVHQGKLVASDGAAFDQFGLSVSVSGNVAVVGAFGNDDAGSSSGSAYVFDLGILRAINLLLALIDAVIDLNLQQGIENGLDAKLDLAFQVTVDLNNNNDAAACAALSAFINAVEAQSGNHIPAEDAAALIAAAQEILDLLQCG